MQLSDFERYPNLVAMFLDRAATRGDTPFLWAKQGGSWQSLSWAQVADQVCLLARSLRDLGLADGERVMLVSENRPEWCIADLAIMAAGLITVPVYTTNTERDHFHLLENSGARAVIVSTARLALPLLPALLKSGVTEHVIAIEPLRQAQAGIVRFHQWSDMIAGDPAPARAEVERRVATIGRRDMACIIYTSGTGGAPRGVMLHHGSILANVAGAAEIIAEDFSWGDEVFLSFLPLSHAYEHSGGQFLPIVLGAQIYYAESLDRLASNIEEVRPTVMIVVPRLFEVLRTRIIRQIEKQGKVASGLLRRAMALGDRGAGPGARWRDKPTELLLSATLRPKVRKKFGGRIKALVSGGAPLNPEVGVFFKAMGLTVLQGYGQTEAGPLVSCNRPAAGIKMDSVGPPLRGVQVRIAEDGEILVAGELVMLGYWRNPAETARVLKPGGWESGADTWLHTGDIGHIDEAGRIVITDRKKDMIVNDKGDNVAPQKVEGMLTLQPEIMQAMVAGDRRPYLVALIVPDAEWTAEWAREHGYADTPALLAEVPAYRAALRTAIDRVNRDLSVVEKVRQFTLTDEPFSIENEEMTPSLKIRRHKIRERYGARLDGLYRG